MFKETKRVYIGSDHAGYSLKEFLCETFQAIPLIDCGVFDETPSDYAKIAHLVVKKMKEDPGSIGILLCGSGIGIAIAANRHTGIRAALCHDAITAHLSRSHNDANILVLGSRLVTPEIAKQCLEIFLNTPFEGGRHEERVRHIEWEGK